MLEHVDSIENGLRLEGLFVLFSFENFLELFWTWKLNWLHFDRSIHFESHAFIGIWIILNLNRWVFFFLFVGLRNLGAEDTACVLNAAN